MKRSFYIFLAVLTALAGNARAGWEEVAAMNSPRRSPGAAVVDGKIYVFGGLGARLRSPEASAECYDPQSDEWEEIEPLPIPLHSMGVAAIGRLVFIFGGMSQGGAVSDRVYIYDTRQNDYRRLERAMPQPRRGCTAQQFNNRLILIGGVDDRDRYIDNCYLLEPDSARWTEFSALSQPRAGFGTARRDDELWVVGGAFHGPIAAVERLRDRRWEGVARLPMASSGLAAAFIGDTLAVIGGSGRMNMPTNRMMGYLPQAGRWFEMQDTLNNPRMDFALVRLGDDLYALGGVEMHLRGEMRPLTTVERFSIATAVTDEPSPQAFRFLPPFPNPANGAVNFTLPAGAIRVLLYDPSGRLLVSRNLPQGGAWSWNTAGFPAGVYPYILTPRNGASRTGTVTLVK